uniref:Uncharacterized protein n=1 Tax=Anguilla anguilla TaxID=7936 RepID=A0A0E9VLW8_ANGAN
MLPRQLASPTPTCTRMTPTFNYDRITVWYRNMLFAET